jgi:hypothetical protein
MQKKFFYLIAVAVTMFAVSCQKMDRPTLGDYPKDSNPPGGPLKFYVAFDGSSTNPLMNAVDSIKANFPADNPFTSGTGITSKGVTGVNGKFIKYSSFNDWAGSSSFTMSVWFKQNGQTKNNNGTNGPNYIFSLKAQDGYHWSGAVGFVFLEGDNTACAVKTLFVSPSDPADPNSGAADNWFTWEGGETIAGLCDNNWHNMVITYDQSNSSMKLYIDGVQNSHVKTWPGHGALRIATTRITEYRFGAGPSTNYASDDWLACSAKGSLDQFRLYGTVLTQAEITSLFTSKK